MKRHRSGYVRIDISEVMDEIEDEWLLEEVKHRKLIVPGDAVDFIPEDDIREACEELLRGRPHEALAILQRIVSPKWSSVKASQKAFEQATFHS